MKYTKNAKSVMIADRSNGNISVPEGKPSDNAYYDFEHKETVAINDGEHETLVPFHAIDYLLITNEVQTVVKPDAHCAKTCEEMSPPELFVPSEGIETLSDEEFNPMEGVSAYDDNGINITQSVNVTAERL